MVKQNRLAAPVDEGPFNTQKKPGDRDHRSRWSRFDNLGRL